MIKNCFLSLLFSITMTCQAQNISLVVPYTPGGVTDQMARALEKTLSHKLSYNIVVEYQTGAGGIIAANNVAKNTSKDTVLLIHSSAIATNTFNPNSTYNLIQDFVPVAKLGSVPLVLVANPQSAVASVKQLKQPGVPSFYASAGAGTANHIAGEILQQQLNKELSPVFYKGETLALTDVLYNHVPMMFASVSVIAGYASSGQLSMLAITGTQRNSKLPMVPTFAEQGIRGFERSPNWLVLLSNAGADTAIISKIQTALNESFANSQDQERYQRAGVDPNRQPTANVREFLVEEIEKARIMQARLQK
jgi:tripartite-type tricarboxylate transporter receptor subunit TctC